MTKLFKVHSTKNTKIIKCLNGIIFKSLSFITIAAVLSGITAGSAVLHSRKTTTHITEGVDLVQNERITDSGLLNINTITANLENDNIDFGVFSDESNVSKKRTIEKFAVNKKTIAAVNGSYFSYSQSEGTSSAVGPVVSDGKLLSCSASFNSDTYKFASLCYSKDNVITIEYLQPYMTVQNEKGKTYKIARYNTAYSGGAGICYRDSTYSGSSPGNKKYKGVTEISVVNGIMDKLREDKAPITIANNAYTLTATGNGANKLKKLFISGGALTVSLLTNKPEANDPPADSPLPTSSPSAPSAEITAATNTLSDSADPSASGNNPGSFSNTAESSGLAADSSVPVTESANDPSVPAAESPVPSTTQPPNVKISDSIPFSQMKACIPGGAQLVKDGKALKDFTHVPSGSTKNSLHPRTAVGISKNGKTVFLVTVDGRQAASKGMSMVDLAKLMKNKGAYNAINMDGGGSTSMIALKPGAAKPDYINIPSESRAVINSVGIYSTAPSDGVVTDMSITPESSVFLATMPNTLNAKGYDASLSVAPVTASEIKWSAEGIEGVFNKNVFTPSKAGKGKLIAEYKGKTYSKNIYVRSAPFALVPGKTSLALTASSVTSLSISAVNKHGFYQKLNPAHIDYSASGSVGTIDNGVFTASSSDAAGYITAKAGKLTYSIPTSINGASLKGVSVPSSDKFSDPAAKKIKKANYTVFIGGQSKKLTKSAGKGLNKFTKKSNKKADLLIVSGNTTYDFTKHHKKSYINVFTGYSNTSVFGTDFIELDVNKGTMYGSSSQQWSFLKSALSNANHSIILLHSSPEKWSNKKEALLFNKYLKTAYNKTGKVIWLITYGSAYSSKLKSGIRYITIPEIAKNKKRYQYLQITIKNKKPSYQVCKS